MECKFKAGDYVKRYIENAFSPTKAKRVVEVTGDDYNNGFFWLRFVEGGEIHPDHLFYKVPVMDIIEARLDEV